MPGPLRHSPADVISQLLVYLGLGTSFDSEEDWTSFASGEPDLPDNCLTTYDTTGRDEGRVMVGGERQEHHGFQVRIRSKTQAEGYAKARAIAVAFDEEVYFDVVRVDDEVYLVWSISRNDDPLFIGKDAPKSKRSLHTLNCVVSVRQLSLASILQENGGKLLQESGLLLSWE